MTARVPTIGNSRALPDLVRPMSAPKRSRGNRRRVTGATAPMTTHERIFAAVRRVPRGRVATYGQIAVAAGLAGQPRLVGYALHSLPSGTAVPWHRVVNARGMVSIRADGTASLSQRLLLEREGIVFDARGRLSLERFGWHSAARGNHRTTTRRPR